MSDHIYQYIICYDIAHKKRLRRIHRLVRDYALPAQFSVFEAELKQTALQQLIDTLTKEINQEEDKIVFYQRHPSSHDIKLGKPTAGQYNNDLLLF